MFYKDMRGASFVCLDDISGRPEGLNRVIYNPKVDDIYEASYKLHDVIFEQFGVLLTSEELDKLTSYDSNHLDDFAYELRKIIKNKRGG